VKNRAFFALFLPLKTGEKQTFFSVKIVDSLKKTSAPDQKDNIDKKWR
jgi:hypothetical protein